VKLVTAKTAAHVHRTVHQKLTDIQRHNTVAVKTDYAETARATPLHSHALRYLLKLTAAVIRYAEEQKIRKTVR